MESPLSKKRIVWGKDLALGGRAKHTRSTTNRTGYGKVWLTGGKKPGSHGRAAAEK